MMPESLPSWLLPLWHELMARRVRLPHALLFCGPSGSGKRLFAEHLARALLCEHPGVDGFACGHCADCTWMASGNHPDFFTLIPAADAVELEAGGEGGESGKKEKAKSSQILIEQVRSLQTSLEVGGGGHAGGRRVAIIDPAEAMNIAAANALLKALEEPPGNTVYLLLSHAPRRLLPTIRSRCQVQLFPHPSFDEAVAWMSHEGVDNDALLGFAGGLPIAARDYAQGAFAEIRAKLAEDMSSMAVRDPLRLAAEWESRLKAKAAQDSGFNMAIFLDWLSRWLSDGVRVAQGLPPRFFRDYEKPLSSLALGHAEDWLSAYREIQERRRFAMHPLNLRLFLEDVLLSVYRKLSVRREAA